MHQHVRVDENACSNVCVVQWLLNAKKCLSFQEPRPYIRMPTQERAGHIHMWALCVRVCVCVRLTAKLVLPVRQLACFRMRPRSRLSRLLTWTYFLLSCCGCFGRRVTRRCMCECVCARLSLRSVVELVRTRAGEQFEMYRFRIRCAQSAGLKIAFPDNCHVPELRFSEVANNYIKLKYVMDI